MSDLVQRLRKCPDWVDPELAVEAADRIEELEKMVQEVVIQKDRFKLALREIANPSWCPECEIVARGIAKRALEGKHE